MMDVMMMMDSSYDGMQIQNYNRISRDKPLNEY